MLAERSLSGARAHFSTRPRRDLWRRDRIEPGFPPRHFPWCSRPGLSEIAGSTCRKRIRIAIADFCGSFSPLHDNVSYVIPQDTHQMNGRLVGVIGYGVTPLQTGREPHPMNTVHGRLTSHRREGNLGRWRLQISCARRCIATSQGAPTSGAGWEPPAWPAAPDFHAGSEPPALAVVGG